FAWLFTIFQSRYGKSYLFSKVANVYAEKKENRMMMTGLHTVADIYFVKCGSYVGWRYVKRKHSMLLFFFLA
ncbi:unnamed protein product, partial [Brassica oleracea var. botrytis]